MKYETYPTFEQFCTDLAELRKKQQIELTFNRDEAYLSMLNRIFDFQKRHPTANKLRFSYQAQSPHGHHVFLLHINQDNTGPSEEFSFLKEFFPSLEDIKLFLELKGFNCSYYHKSDTLYYII